jgi:hypothetical protein
LRFWLQFFLPHVLPICNAFTWNISFMSMITKSLSLKF